MTVQRQKLKLGVLFVDDEEHVLRAMRRLLRKEPYTFYFANGPDQGMDTLRQHRSRIHVVISDYKMPGIDGLTFLKLVKTVHPSVVRVILTGHADLEMAIDAINDGEIFRLLTKPLNTAQLRMTLRQISEVVVLRRQNEQLMGMVKRQRALIERLEEEHPGVLDVRRDADGVVLLEDLEAA